MKLSRQIVAMTVCVLLTAVVVVSALSAYGVFEVLQDRAKAELELIGENKKTGFIRYHQNLLRDVEALANTVLVTEALLEFDVASASLDDAGRLAWKKTYEEDEFLLASEKETAEDTPTLAGYRSVHSRYHRSLLEVQQSQDLNDVILINADGLVVYSSAKRKDFGSSVNGELLADSVPAQAFRRFVSAGSAIRSSFFDYKRYHGASDSVVGFVAAPVLVNDTPRGVLLFQLRADALDGLMALPPGLFDSGEIIVVGEDFMVRNDTAFTRDAPLNRRLDIPPVRLALSGNSGFTTTKSSSGYHLAYATPVDIDGQIFALVVSQPVEALLTPYRDVGATVGIGLAAAVLLLVWVSVVAGRRLASPVAQIAACQKRLAEGHTGVSAPGLSSPKEVADMGDALYVFTKNARQVERYRQDEEEKKELSAEVHGNPDRLEQFEEVLNKAVEAFANTIPHFTKQKTDIGRTIDGQGGRTGAARDDARRVMEDTGALAKSTERVNSAISDVTEKVEAASSLSGSVQRQALDVATRLTDLNNAGNRLDMLADSISQIAGRTNLVSLNASLEASRGETNGNGYAVIASEIKSIASQIQLAAEETRNRHADIREDLEATLVAARMISDTASNASDAVRSLEGAVALQAVAAGDIARTARAVAKKIEVLVDNMTSLADGVAATEHGVRDIASTSDALTETGTHLVNEVSKMLAELKYPQGKD